MRLSPPARCLFWVPAVTALLAGAVTAADAPVTVAVRPSVLFAGGDVRATVRTPRDARNRELRIVVESPSYYSSSDVQLDGESAASLHQFTLKALPGGDYRVEAILQRAGGESRSFVSCFAVLSGDERATGAARRTPPARGGGAGGC